jgi:hypothetical protein
MARLRLSMAMRLTGPGARSQRAFVELNALAAGAGGSAALAEHPDDLLACPPQRSEWSPLSEDDPGIGFHDLEVRQHRPFRWSEPAALVALLATGRRTHITIEWVPLSGIDHDRARFYIDEQPLPASAVEHRSATTVLTIDHEPGPMRLGWVIEEACADGDPRPLGLPVFAITWGEDPDVRRPAARAPRSDTRWRRDQPRAGSGRG